MRRNPIARLLCLWLAFAPVSGRAGTLAQFRTVFGDIDVELFDQDKPATVANFKRYVQAGLYQNNFLHRCVPGFIVQGGGFFTLNPLSTNNFTDFYHVPAFPPVTNEFAVGPRISNTFGTIAMAKVGGDPDSATSQWFFNLGNNSTNLDNQNGGFTVFGRVVRGTNVLNTYNLLAYGNYLQDLGWYYGTDSVLGQLFNALPVTYQGIGVPWYSDLHYFDVSLLQLKIRRVANDTCRISWRSVDGRTNLVEYSNRLPPVNWQPLIATNGNGATYNVTDASTNAARRFYRVRVVY